jgi:succinate-acetate transporter protein
MAQLAAQKQHAESEAGVIANAAPLGLSAFALTTAVLSCVNAGFIVPSAGVNIFVGSALFYGGLVQILAGMWEFKRGNVLPATAFSSYGGFWITTAVIFIPGFGILYGLSSTSTLHQARHLLPVLGNFHRLVIPCYAEDQRGSASRAWTSLPDHCRGNRWK